MTRYDEVMTAARVELLGLIRQKDPAGIAAIRALMAEVENACAVPVEGTVDMATSVSAVEDEAVGENGEPTQYIAGAGRYGQTEATRRVLSDDEVDQIVGDEIAMRREEEATFNRLDREREAAIAGYQAALIQRVAQR